MGLETPAFLTGAMPPDKGQARCGTCLIVTSSGLLPENGDLDSMRSLDSAVGQIQRFEKTISINPSKKP
jgi:hypothetical protein